LQEKSAIRRWQKTMSSALSRTIGQSEFTDREQGTERRGLSQGPAGNGGKVMRSIKMKGYSLPMARRGHIDRVVIDPQTKAVTHLVVRNRVSLDER
jgi:hypothetical protein